MLIKNTFIGIMDINTISQITVAYKSGEIVVYKKKGLEKLRKLISQSPVLKETSYLIIEDDEGDIPDDQYNPSGPLPPSAQGGEKPYLPQQGGGHATISLNYDPLTKASFTDRMQMAQQMRKQAESKWKN